MKETTAAALKDRDETLAEFFERAKSNAPGTSTAATQEVVPSIRTDRDASNP